VSEDHLIIVSTVHICREVQHHLLQGDHNAESLVVHNGNGFPRLRSFNAAQHTGEHAPGAVGIVDLVPDNVLHLRLRFRFAPGIQCQNISLLDSGRGRFSRGGSILSRRRSLLLHLYYLFCSGSFADSALRLFRGLGILRHSHHFRRLGENILCRYSILLNRIGCGFRQTLFCHRLFCRFLGDDGKCRYFRHHGKFFCFLSRHITFLLSSHFG